MSIFLVLECQQAWPGPGGRGNTAVRGALRKIDRVSYVREFLTVVPKSYCYRATSLCLVYLLMTTFENMQRKNVNTSISRPVAYTVS
ncbi:hypothetical protein OUZ56_005301 [Daphnia magna]|uniref:Uncharacterized protein n=1 Tax=Daphnia magna TaxID=35525 RepID=A0ABQ9YSF1_9CRUS|nr:hypothetical protein OUZ56_005301 [Daphnia magna]